MALDEMWERLAQHQSFADARGYGSNWARMCALRTWQAAIAAHAAAHAQWAWVAADAAWAASAASWAEAWAPASDDLPRAVRAAIYWIEKAEGKNNE